MRFLVVWSRSPSLPEVRLQPCWDLAWGNLQKLPSGASWQDRRLAIVHARPVFSDSQRFVVVGDVWLSNRMSLLHRLGIETVADIQLVVQLWERLGWESLSLLEGMFALAI